MSRILVIDNYDSFTWNLVHLVGPQVDAIEVVRNDRTTVADIFGNPPDAIVISPGPCTPDEAGISLELVREAGPRIPILGVCLGLQAIGQAFGGRVVRAPEPRHGKVGEIRHNGRGLFGGIEGPFSATRYHSLVVDRPSCPDCLEITAESQDGLIMAAAHRRWPIHGVQFHPESVLSEHGATLVRNFLAEAAAWNAAERSNAAKRSDAGKRDSASAAVH